ncbi:putative acetylpolyamine aminohydrolase [Mycena rebaudengoi]|nr:putative acetylpolyamine aminohydrolase [Mycena rebaudengoi]
MPIDTPTPVLHCPLSLLHDPPHEILSGALQPYFESPERYHRILNELASSTNYTPISFDWKREGIQEEWLMTALRAIHPQEYLDFLAHIYEEWIKEGGSRAAALPETFLRSDLLFEPETDDGKQARGVIDKLGRYSFDLSCPITADTYVAALASCRLALEGANILPAEPSLPAVFALCRPPGHHATPNLCGGYCFISNAAVAARFLQSQCRSYFPSAEPPKIAILDIDYHHGNGTSKCFYSDPTVLYVSLHGSPDYPYYTGAATERGSGPGLSFNLNFPLPLHTSNATYLSTLGTAIAAIQAYSPAYLIVSLGVDTYEDDPLTEFALTMEAYPAMGKMVRGVGVQTLFVMEGGYAMEGIGACVKGVLDGFREG